MSFFGLRVAKEYERHVIFVLGRYRGLRGPGLYWSWPLITKIQVVDIRVNTVDVAAQDTVTRDSVTIKVNAVLYFKVFDPKKAVLEVANYHSAIYQIALTTLRNVIGQNNLDEVLNNRDQINGQIKEIVDKITDAWGLEVQMVEMKDVEIPTSMQRAMAKEAEAIREKRARIIKAEGESEASKKLAEAANAIAASPAGLELRRMQMITEVGAENNTTTILMMPSDFVNLANRLTTKLTKDLENDK